ncbi:hypothetical protein Tsubulata_003686 [Turnera subulata]|uniref:DUF4283 domain-containing protein n=1 Tax=Turnera subulata TaxID=218843 RepID=A0A9Q0GGV0_9ROSI|nr:hypothetical protein Tsubulata_003686 [Turnera subulata]
MRLSVHLRTPRLLGVIASVLIGKPLYVEKPVIQGQRVTVPRICVEVNADSEFPGYVEFEGAIDLGLPSVLVRVEYEWLPPHCKACKSFSHDGIISSCISFKLLYNKYPRLFSSFVPIQISLGPLISVVQNCLCKMFNPAKARLLKLEHTEPDNIGDVLYAVEESGVFIFVFEDSQWKQRIIDEGPWFLDDGRPLILKPWEPSVCLVKEARSVPIWIKLPGLNLHLRTPLVLSKIASVIARQTIACGETSRRWKIYIRMQKF